MMKGWIGVAFAAGITVGTMLAVVLSDITAMIVCLGVVATLLLLHVRNHPANQYHSIPSGWLSKVWREVTAVTPLFTNRFLNLWEVSYGTEEGEQSYSLLQLKNAVAGLPYRRTKSGLEVCILRHFRPTGSLLELPGGIISEDPRESLARELSEEAGIEPENILGMTHITRMIPASDRCIGSEPKPGNAITPWTIDLYLVKVSGRKNGKLTLDQEEHIECRWLPLELALRLVEAEQGRGVDPGLRILLSHLSQI